MDSKNTLAERMKTYEKLIPSDRLVPLLPAFARIDGKNFHNYTRNFARPFDLHFHELMRMVTELLMEETNAKIAYTQSDEITLSWYSYQYESQIFFDGKIQKMVSVLSSMTTAFFNSLIVDFPYLVKNRGNDYAFFDCRVWNVPNLWEASNVFIWREEDAIRNSVQMASRNVFSHKECENKNVNQLKIMLKEKGIDWNNYPEFFKRGTYIQKKQFIDSYITNAENEEIPIYRSKISELKIPIISSIANCPEVLYSGFNPVLKKGI